MDNVIQLLLVLSVGFVFGIQHALEIDHVVAVTTLSSRSKSLLRAVIQAALWGLGHSVTLLIVGILVLIFKVGVPEQISTFFEAIVGVLLIVLGINVIRLVFAGQIHRHSHAHDENEHAHIHDHSHSEGHHHHHERSFLVGIVHGLAGSSALVLLVLSSFDSVAIGIGFILAFGVGSIIGMCLITLAFAVPMKLSLDTVRINNLLQFAAGSAGIIVGFYVLFHTLNLGI